MQFIGDIESVSFPSNLKPLFEAMQNGKTIRSVTCIWGQINGNNRDKDFIIENFVATHYIQRMQTTFDNAGSFDYVYISHSRFYGFYMSWVLSFSL